MVKPQCLYHHCSLLMKIVDTLLLGAWGVQIVANQGRTYNFFKNIYLLVMTTLYDSWFLIYKIFTHLSLQRHSACARYP